MTRDDDDSGVNRLVCSKCRKIGDVPMNLSWTRFPGGSAYCPECQNQADFERSRREDGSDEADQEDEGTAELRGLCEAWESYRSAQRALRDSGYRLDHLSSNVLGRAL